MSSNEEFAEWFYQSGRNLMKHAWHPVLAFALARAILSPEATIDDIASTGSAVLSVIVTAALFCFGVSLGLSMSTEE
jgi:hypothetical protein